MVKIKTSNKNKNKVVYGKLSRKDQEFVREFGYLPSEMVDEDDQEGIDEQRVYDEEELDRMDRYEDSSQLKRKFEQDSDEEEEEDEEEMVGAYDRLLMSLKADSDLEFDDDLDTEDEKDIEDGNTEDDDDDETMHSASSGEELNEDYLSEESEPVEEEQEQADNDCSGDETSDAGSEESEYEGDIFHKHFASVSDANFYENVKKVDMKEWNNSNFFDTDFDKVSVQSVVSNIPKALSMDPVSTLNIKKRLLDKWQLKPRESTSFQLKYLNLLNSYKDLTISSMMLRNHDELMEAYALHCLNHVYKSRDNLMKNNEKLKKSTEEELEFRDQGFTRPKVLILVPFRNVAYKLVKFMSQLALIEQQENKTRFEKDFGPGEFETDPKKPEDYQEIFRGNFDDCYRLGIRFSRKSMKLYSEFYSSDIIVASPLGLRMIIGAEGDKERDFDFLSSIEVLVVDGANVMLMQNWDHLTHIFKHLNRIPKESHGCDFSRLKTWYLDGKAKYLRQTVLMSSFLTPEINALIKNHCFNVAGKVKNKQNFHGSIKDVIPRIQHTFQRIKCSSLTQSEEARFRFFTEKTFPSLKSSTILQNHTCIIVPSYFEFLRLRKWFEDEEISHCAISEYSSNPDITRGRSMFFHGHCDFLLLTERFHFFRRYQLRGIRNLIFYGPMYYSHFYPEFVNMVASGGDFSDEANGNVVTLYTRYDALALERIIGTDTIDRLISGDKSIYMFA